MTLRDLLPPVLVAAAKRSAGSRRIFGTYDEALAMCNNGYQDEALVDTVYEKTRRYRDALAACMPVSASLPLMRIIIAAGLSASDGAVNVIDFGGACGAHYFLSSAVFGPRLNMKWHVVETPRMAAKARSLEDGCVKFFDTIEDAQHALDRVDLVFSSSTLQYVPRPYETLDRLTEVGAAHIFITRVGLIASDHEIITTQRSHLSANGVGPLPETLADGIVKYPVTFPLKTRIEEILFRRYTIRLALEEDKAEYIVNGRPIDLYGYYGVRR